MKEYGMLTSGGDWPGFERRNERCGKGIEQQSERPGSIWIFDGYKGLIYGNYRLLTAADFSGILTKEELSWALPVSLLNRCVCRMPTVWIKWKP